MKLRTFISVVTLAGLTAADSANAEFFTGSSGFAPWGGSGGSYTSSSLTLQGVNFINVLGSGTFASLQYDGLTAYNSTLTGLSASPKPENVANYFQFASASPISSSLGNGGNGNIYSLTLTSLTEFAPGSFSGTRTLIDSTGTLQNTPAAFTLSFSGSYNYSVSIVAVPEPTTISLFATAMAGLLVVRRRKG